MSLLIFLPTEFTLQPQFAELLQPSLRRDVASRVNEAILKEYSPTGEARIRSLVRLRVWAEDKARAAGKDIPPVLSLGLQDVEDPMNEANGNAEAGDAMVS